VSYKGNRKWQEASWSEKVGICQRGMSQQDSIGLTHTTIYISLEALLFAFVFTGDLTDSYIFIVIIAILGIIISLLFSCFFHKRANHSDKYGESLYYLFIEQGRNDLAEPYKGCFERKNKIREKHWNWWFQIVVGWGWNPLKWFTPRRFICTYTPLLIIIAWITILCLN
jgi:hypothetical protein